MDAEILARLIQVRNDLRTLVEVVAWECSPKTEREFKRQVKALTKIIKQLKAENIENRR